SSAMPSFSRATAAMRCIFAAWAISISDGMPLCSPSWDEFSLPLLHQQDRGLRDVQHLVRDRAEQRLAERGHAAGADVDQVAALGLGVLDDRLGHRADQDARLVRNARGVELLLGLREH